MKYLLSLNSSLTIAETQTMSPVLLIKQYLFLSFDSARHSTENHSQLYYIKDATDTMISAGFCTAPWRLRMSLKAKVFGENLQKQTEDSAITMSVKNILKLLSLSAQRTYTNLQKLEQVDVAASSSNVFALSKRKAQE